MKYPINWELLVNLIAKIDRDILIGEFSHVIARGVVIGNNNHGTAGTSGDTRTHFDRILPYHLGIVAGFKPITFVEFAVMVVLYFIIPGNGSI